MPAPSCHHRYLDSVVIESAVRGARRAAALTVRPKDLLMIISGPAIQGHLVSG